MRKQNSFKILLCTLLLSIGCQVWATDPDLSLTSFGENYGDVFKTYPSGITLNAYGKDWAYAGNDGNGSYYTACSNSAINLDTTTFSVTANVQIDSISYLVSCNQSSKSEAFDIVMLGWKVVLPAHDAAYTSYAPSVSKIAETTSTTNKTTTKWVSVDIHNDSLKTVRVYRKVSKAAIGTSSDLGSKNKTFNVWGVKVWLHPTGGPAINASNVTIDADATSGEIAYSLSNLTATPTAAKTSGDWISNVQVDATNNKVTFDATANTSSEDRTGTITISCTGATDKVVTVTQKKVVTYTNYDKVSALSMVIGGTYVWYGQKTDGSAKAVAASMGSNTYFGATTLAGDSKIEGNQLKLTTETPQQFIFNQVADADWTIADAGTPANYLYVSGDKKIKWGTDVNVWALSGTDEPQFACSSYNNTAYTMFYNSGSTRFNAYKAIGTMDAAVLYHLASEATSTLTLNYNDGATTKSYIIKEGFAWNLLTPERDGYDFEGWATTATGTVVYADKAAYTMGADDAVLYAIWSQQTSAPTITTDLNATYSVEKTKTVTLSIVADGADEYEWYTNTTASTEGATMVDGATEASYAYPASETVGNVTYVYCVAKNSVGNANSAIAAVTTNGRTDCQLISAKYSNSFYGAIAHPTASANGTVEVRYMEGQTAPTLTTTVEVSAGATYVNNGTAIVVTAEDGTTTATYNVNIASVTPLAVSADVATTNFTEVPSWIYNHYGYDDSKGIKFAKNVNNDGTQRVTFGNTRQYYFVGAAKTLTLTSSLSSRNINVYRNGVKLDTPTATGAADATIEIALDENAPCMITIESNQTGGDGGFKAYAIKAAPTSAQITISAASYATYYNSAKAYIMPDDCGGYVFTANGGLVRVYGDGEIVPAGEPLVIYTIEPGTKTLTFTTSSEETYKQNDMNDLDGTDTETALTADENSYFYGLSLNAAGDLNSVGFYWIAADGAAFTNGAHKAYLKLAKSSDAPARFLFNPTPDSPIVTGLEAVAGEGKAVKFLKDGQLFILKNGKVFNAAGQVVK